MHNDDDDDDHHHHDVVPLARISLTLSRHFSLSFIASGRSSGLHPVPSQSCCMYVLACRPALARPYVEVHRSTSLMSFSLLPQQCPACLVRLTWIVFVMGGRWPYSSCFVGVAARTYSLLLATFLCNCCLACSRIHDTKRWHYIRLWHNFLSISFFSRIYLFIYFLTSKNPLKENFYILFFSWLYDGYLNRLVSCMVWPAEINL